MSCISTATHFRSFFGSHIDTQHLIGWFREGGDLIGQHCHLNDINLKKLLSFDSFCRIMWRLEIIYIPVRVPLTQLRVWLWTLLGCSKCIDWNVVLWWSVRKPHSVRVPVRHAVISPPTVSSPVFWRQNFAPNVYSWSSRDAFQFDLNEGDEFTFI